MYGVLHEFGLHGGLTLLKCTGMREHKISGNFFQEGIAYLSKKKSNYFLLKSPIVL